MLEKLKELALRHEDLEAQLADPAVYNDAARLRTINRELKELGPIVETWHAMEQAEQRRAGAEELLRDPDLRELAQEELSAAKAELERLQEELKILLLPKDPNDSRNVIMELRGGVSPANVHHVRPKPGLEAGHREPERDGAGRRQGVQRPH